MKLPEWERNAILRDAVSIVTAARARGAILTPAPPSPRQSPPPPAPREPRRQPSRFRRAVNEKRARTLAQSQAVARLFSRKLDPGMRRRRTFSAAIPADVFAFMEDTMSRYGLTRSVFVELLVEFFREHRETGLKACAALPPVEPWRKTAPAWQRVVEAHSARSGTDTARAA